ncbi:MAG: hypothetical protein IKW45_06470 [Clostridia bacterium]|nr:hypothetical protein [Clostridia bacterium]
MTDFFYHNVNPDKSVEQDCVTRAISLASGIPYKAVSKLLKVTATEERCDELCVCCYHHLLEETLGYRVKFARNKERVEDIAKEYKNNIVIVRIDGHLTACVYGTCVDIWDCTKEIVDCFWIVQ